MTQHSATDAKEWEEKRRMTLTQDDLDAISERFQCVSCQFTKDEADTLKKFATSVNRTQKIASWLIITGVVTSVFTGIYHAIKYYVINVIMKDGVK